jgi:hypothetical protein
MAVLVVSLGLVKVGGEDLPECEAVEDLGYGVVGAVGIGEDAE